MKAALATNMKYAATMTLISFLGVATLHTQEMPVQMTLSGTAATSTVNLQTGTGVSEYHLAGKGTLGQFTLRVVSAGAASPQLSSTCSGLYIPTLAGEGVFRFQDGSLMKLHLTEGFDCIDLAAQEAHCVRIFQITGGTGRYQDASGGTVTLSMRVAPVVRNIFSFSTVTAEITGTISGVAGDADHGAQQ